MGVNSRQKGKVGEREFAALLRDEGFAARRGQQFAGGTGSPDVVCPELAWLHFEVKRVEKLNLTDACAQAEGDAHGKPWVVAHRRNHAPWLVTMRAELFFRLLRGDVAHELHESHEEDRGEAATENSKSAETARDSRDHGSHESHESDQAKLPAEHAEHAEKDLPGPV